MLVNVSTHYHHDSSLASMLSLVSAGARKPVNHRDATTLFSTVNERMSCQEKIYRLWAGHSSNHEALKCDARVSKFVWRILSDHTLGILR